MFLIIIICEIDHLCRVCIIFIHVFFLDVRDCGGTASRAIPAFGDSQCGDSVDKRDARSPPPSLTHTQTCKAAAVAIARFAEFTRTAVAIARFVDLPCLASPDINKFAFAYLVVQMRIQ